MKSSTVGSLGKSLAKTHLSSNDDTGFTPEQCERLFCDVGGYCPETQEEYCDGKRNCYNVAKNVIANSQKLLLEGQFELFMLHLLDGDGLRKASDFQ